MSRTNSRYHLIMFFGGSDLRDITICLFLNCCDQNSEHKKANTVGLLHNVVTSKAQTCLLPLWSCCIWQNLPITWFLQQDEQNLNFPFKKSTILCMLPYKFMHVIPFLRCHLNEKDNNWCSFISWVCSISCYISKKET